MNKYFYVYFIIIIIILIVAIIGWNYWRKSRIIKQLRSNYGKEILHSYDERSFNEIKQYLDAFPIEKAQFVDHQTWLDLEMNELYSKLNHTQSTIGSSYLYRLLRTQSNPNLNKFEEYVKYFASNEKERLSLQYAFYSISKNDHYSLINYIAEPDIFPKIPFFTTVFFGLIGILPILLFFINPTLAIDDGIGIFFLVMFFIVDVLLFSYTMTKTEKAWSVIATLASSIEATKSISKLNKPIFQEDIGTVKNINKSFSWKFDVYIQLANFLTGSNSGIFLFISVYFGLYAYVYQGMVDLLKKEKQHLKNIYDIVGYFDSCIAIASYKETLTYYCVPIFSEQSTISFTEIYHPLIENPVSNSKEVEPFHLITGANASGKTTFAKTIAINAIIAQTLNFSYAKEFIMKHAKVYSSIKIEDSLLQGNSFYMAEIKRIQYLLQVAKDNPHSLFFIDEMLKGTNVTERIAASAAILKEFTKYDCFLCLTTHDIELTEILKNKYYNYHFREYQKDNQMHYDFKIYDGVTTGSNAIALLSICDYEKRIVEEALELVEKYKVTGEWKA